MSKTITVQPSGSYMSFHTYMEMADDRVASAVSKLDAQDLADERSLLIARLMPSLIIQSPRIAWATADFSCMELSKNRWRHTLVVSIDDPSWTLWSVEWPSQNRAEFHFSAEPDSGMLIAVETVAAENRESSNQVFTRLLDEFKVNLLKAQMEFDRYNAALPYLISFAIENALAGCLDGGDDPF